MKLEKCSFFRPEVSYLGHVISREGVATDPGKIEGFAKLAAPLHHLVAQLTGTKARKPSKASLHAASVSRASRSVSAPVLAYANSSLWMPATADWVLYSPNGQTHCIC